MKTAICALLTAVLPAGAAVATEQSQTSMADTGRVYQMQETIVTAAPIVAGTRVTKHAETLALISDRQILDLHAQDLPASLRRVPGVSISRYNLVGNYGGGDGGAVFVRGHGSARPGGELSTMVDGIPRFNGFWTHPLMDLMAVDIAQRIEVQKSPRPVANGNMAFSAIDVQTRRFEREGFTTRLNSSGGSYGTLVGQLTHGGRRAQVDYLLSASHRESDGHRENADGETESYFGRIGYRLGKHWDLSFLVNKTQGWAHDPLPVGAEPTPVTNRYDTDSEFYLGTVTWRGLRGEAWLKAYYDNGYADWRQWDEESDPPEQENGISDYGNYGVRSRATLTGPAGSELLLGLDYDTNGGSFVSNRTSGPGEEVEERLINLAPYAMISRTWGRDVRWTPSVGARINASNEFGTQLGAQAGLVAERGPTQIHASWARAYNLPGVYAAIFYGQYWQFAYEGNEWKRLEPEWLNHLELGGSHTFSDRLAIDMTVYRDHVTNALRIVPPPPPPPSIQNIGEYTTQGLEVAIDFMPVSDLRLFAGGTLTETSPEDTPNTPDLSLSGGASYTWRQQLRLHVDTEFVDEQYVQGTRRGDPAQQVDAYVLANLRSGYLFAAGPALCEVFLNLENALDEEYEHRAGYPMPGRTWSVGLDLRL